jgi:beta-ribofuranosylaminobenzene 5'-phosphate synthase
MSRVLVSAPARLHLGDIDPFGIGRFGYAPILAIDKPRTVVEASEDDFLTVSGLETEEARLYAKRTLEAFNLRGARVRILDASLRHFGFGSTTQLSLSIGKAITLAYGLDVSVAALSKALKRTSPGGLYAFEDGGFIVAGGFKTKLEEVLKENTALIPPLIFRVKFPENWRFLVISPIKASKSPDGEVEKKTFQTLQINRPPKRLIHEAYFTLMSKLVPSVIDEDAESFGEALTRIQLLVGRIYKPVQGSLFNPASEWIIHILRRNKALGIGQSSWGPTVYAFAESEEKAVEMENAIRKKIENKAEMFIAKADNSGIQVSSSKNR